MVKYRDFRSLMEVELVEMEMGFQGDELEDLILLLYELCCEILMCFEVL
jgi:hypothetical protein